MRLLPLLLVAPLAVLNEVSASPAPNHAPRPPYPTRAERRGQDQSHNGHVIRLPMRRRAPTHLVSTVSTVSTVQEEDERRTRTATSPGMPAPTPTKVKLMVMFQDVAYGVKLWIGNPEQSVILDFDTGSSETWVDPPCTPMEGAGAYQDLCRSLGVYIPQQSDTSIQVNGTCPPAWITYGSGAAYVRYYRDVINFADPHDTSSIANTFKLRKPVQFGLSTWSENMVAGIFGAAYGVGYNQNYSNFIDEIYNQGLVKDKDFSVSLGSVDEENGEVVFGGIDLNKFVGPLHGVTMARQSSKSADGYYRYWVNVTGISVTPPGSCVSTPMTNSTFSERFLPDTGTTLTYMPEDAFFILLNYFPDARLVPSYGYVISCSHLYEEGHVSFSFDGITIHVPYSEFIFQVPPIFPDAKDTTCILGAIPAGSFFILGDTFLRAATALFRQQEHKIYLAQHADCGTHIISSHGNLTGIVGNCGKKHQKGDEDPALDEPYGPYPPLSGMPDSATATGFGTCKAFSTAPYTPLPTTMTSDPDSPVWMNVFPLPAVQTAGPRREKQTRRVALTTTIILDKSGDPDGSSPTAEARGLVTTATTTIPDITLPATTIPGTTMAMADSETDTDGDTNPNTLCKSSSTDCDTESSRFNWSATVVTIASSWSPYSFSGSTRKGSTDDVPTESAIGATQITYTFTDDSTTLATAMTVTEDPDATFSVPSSEVTAITESNWTSWLGSVSGWTVSTSSEEPSVSVSEFTASTTAGATAATPPTAITIPVQTGETVIVKMASTSYTIVDGVTLSQDAELSSTSSSSSSSYEESSRKQPPHVTASHSRHTASAGTGSVSLRSGNWTGIWTHTRSLSNATSASSHKVHTTTTVVMVTSVTTETTITALITSASSPTADDLDGYVTTWAWTAEDDTTTVPDEPVSLATVMPRQFIKARPAREERATPVRRHVVAAAGW